MKTLLFLTAAAAAFLLMPPAVSPEDTDDEPEYEPPTLLDEVVGEAKEAIEEIMATESEEVREQNLKAFMWMLRVSEGTSGPDGYRTIVGGSLFSDYSRHPEVKIWLPKLQIYSTAAGAYQQIRRTWFGVRDKLGLPDFSPASQDAACIELIRQRGALVDVRAGRFAVAVEKCKKEWASLPGAGYGQHENTLARLQTAYTSAGGYLA